MEELFFLMRARVCRDLINFEKYRSESNEKKTKIYKRTKEPNLVVLDLGLFPEWESFLFFFVSQPPTVVCKMEAQLEHVHTAYTGFFFHVWRQFVCSVSAY